MRNTILMTLLALASSHAVAGATVRASSAALQLQIDQNENSFRSCGVRGVIVTPGKHYLDAYDFFLTVHADLPYGTLKAGKVQFPTQTTTQKKSPQETAVHQPIKYWLAQASEGSAIRPIKTFPPEHNGSILEYVNLRDTLRRMRALAHGKPMQFTARHKGSPANVIIRFSAEMPAVDRSQLLACLEGI